MALHFLDASQGTKEENWLLSSSVLWISGLSLWQGDLCIFLLKTSKHGVGEGKFMLTYCILYMQHNPNSGMSQEVQWAPFFSPLSLGHPRWTFIYMPFQRNTCPRSPFRGANWGKGWILPLGLCNHCLCQPGLGFLGWPKFFKNSGGFCLFSSHQSHDLVIKARVLV